MIRIPGPGLVLDAIGRDRPRLACEFRHRQRRRRRAGLRHADAANARSKPCKRCFPTARSSASPRAALLGSGHRRRRVVPLHHPRGAALDGEAHAHRRGAFRPPSVTTWRPISPRPKRFVREAAQPRRASRPAAGAVPGHLFPHAAGPEMVRDRLPRERASLRARAGRARQGAEGGHPDLLLREGRPALLQQRGDGRCRRRDPRASIARATSPTAPAIRRNITSAPATPASRRGRRKPGTIGVGICWDQWYPEAARAMVLEGAEILFYPTAIGSEP